MDQLQRGPYKKRPGANIPHCGSSKRGYWVKSVLEFAYLSKQKYTVCDRFSGNSPYGKNTDQVRTDQNTRIYLKTTLLSNK